MGRSGDVVHGVVGAAESANADLVVVGSRGHGGVSGVLLRSVSNALLSTSTRPLVVVPEGTRDGRAERAWRSLVVAVDGSAASSAPSSRRYAWRPRTERACTSSPFASLPVPA